MNRTIRELLHSARDNLAGAALPGLEAEILLAHALNCERSFLYANPELQSPRARTEAFDHLVRQRIKGMPIAYLTGVREFWSLPLKVTPDTLIPRAETELLVETALTLCPAGLPVRIADLGTGTGAVALAMAHERPEAQIVAVDTSESALAVARENARRLDIDNVAFFRSDWYQALTGHFDLIVSNPPYVAADDPHLRQGDCRFEPRLALSAGGDGLRAIQAIVAGAAEFLRPGGWLLLEHGHDQGASVRAMLAGAGLVGVRTHSDLALLERVSMAQL